MEKDLSYWLIYISIFLATSMLITNVMLNIGIHWLVNYILAGGLHGWYFDRIFKRLIKWKR